jgi:hypothetical protein
MKRFDSPDSFWPFTIRNVFSSTLRLWAMAESAYDKSKRRKSNAGRVQERGEVA